MTWQTSWFMLEMHPFYAPVSRGPLHILRYTGNTNGSAVSNVLIEDITIATLGGNPTVQVDFFMARNRYGSCNSDSAQAQLVGKLG